MAILMCLKVILCDLILTRKNPTAGHVKIARSVKITYRLYSYEFIPNVYLIKQMSHFNIFHSQDT
jgi:hypothetical protein